MRLSPLVLLAALAACGPADTPDPAPPAQEVEAPDPAPTPQPSPADAATDAPPPDSPETLTADGWGPLRIGMSRAELVAAVGDARAGLVTGPEPESCEYFHPVDAPEGVLVMLVDGVLDRITLTDEATLKTAGGVGVGDAATDVKAAYEDAEVQPHQYLDGGEYVTAWRTGSGDAGSRGIRYEIADGRVRFVHAGGPAIRYVEGCS